MNQEQTGKPLFVRLLRPRFTCLLLETILAHAPSGRAALIGIDGVDLSGKSMLAAEISSKLNLTGKHTAVVHCDDFLNARTVRNRKGKWSAVGFYDDFFDFRKIANDVLVPARTGQELEYTIVPISFATDEPGLPVAITCHRDSVVVVEGLFLFRPEFDGMFDLTVRLEIPDGMVLSRALLRDVPSVGDINFVRQHYLLQPLRAQKLYRRQRAPRDRADIVVDNSVTEAPVVLKWIAPFDVSK